MNSPLGPSHIPSSQPSVPQIRSRITVVCAECKRLKLKCDRRNPCGSCTKRDTVSRCIYSPAAAEKVDLHSLNNRLIQVEATLSLLTSGQTPPVFQSSYPYSQIQPNTSNVASSHSLNNRITTQPPTGLSHQHHHHHSATFSSANDFISLSSEDLSSLWLDELDDIDSPPFEVKISRPLKTGASSVKLETSSYAPFNIIDENTFQLSPQATHIHINLPPISVYYAAPERMSETQSTSEMPCVSPQVDAFKGTAPASKPSITPSLVALLPSLVRTRQLLRKAAGVLRERPVPLLASLLSSPSDGINGAGADVDGRSNIKGKNKIYFPSLTTHWNALEFRVMSLMTNRALSRGTSTKATDRKEREKIGARARAIFFGGASSSAASNAGPSLIPQSRTQNPKRDNESEFDTAERTTKERSESLPFFAAVCLLISLGATASQPTEQEGSESHVDSLGQSSTGSETESPEFFYNLAQQSLDVWESNLTSLSVPNAEDKAEEDEKLDYLVASLLAVGYQLYEPFARRKGKDSERRRINALNKAFFSVGKMVNMARAMGLGKDRKSPVRCKDESDAKETLNGKDTKKKVRAEERRKRKDDLRRLIWWDISFYELFISDALGHSSLLSSSPCLVQFPRCAAASNDEIESGQEDVQQEPKSNEDDECSVHEIVERYHGARCRLTKIAQTIKQKLAHPDCCCGYTLDQAAQLEGEVNRFLEGLPPSLRPPFKEEGKEVTTGQSQDMQPSTTDDSQKNIQRLQCYELTTMAQRLIMMVYLPFFRQHSESRSSNCSSAAVTATLSDHNIDSTGQKSDDFAWNLALQPIVTAAQCIIQASKALLPSDQLLTLSLLDLYPLEKTLLDAVIICTHAASFHGTLFSCHQAIEYASSALETLFEMDLDPNYRTLLERVKKKFNITIQNREPPSLYGIKRKHDSIGTEGRGRTPEALKSHSYSSHPSTEVQLPGDRASQQATQTGMPADLTKPSSYAGSACGGRDPETGQKNKKHAKKNHQYPAIGIRVRQRKDGLPLFLKNRIDSPSTSASNPGRESSVETPHQERRVQMNAIATPVDEQDLASLGNFGPSHQQALREDPTPPVMSSLLDDPRYQTSQSSPTSLSQDLHLQSHSQHESRPAAVAYSTAYIEMYEQGQKLSSQEVRMNSSHSDSFDGNKNHDASNVYNHVSRISGPVESNPYGTSCHLSSSSSSPYLENGNSITPLTSFRSATQTITPSSYAQEPTANSNSHTHTYYHIDPEANYSGVSDHPESTPPYGSMGLDASTEASTPIIRTTSSTGMSNAAFEETHAAMYDVKVPLEELIHPQIHHNHMLQHPPYNVDPPPALHLPSPMNQQQAWAHHTDPCPPRFWDTSTSSTGEYKFIH